MEWLSDARQARAGDAAARERLAEYLTPFVHGVALAHAPHHVVEPLVSRILAEAQQGLAAVTDEQQVGAHFVAVARRRAKEAAATARDEVHDPSPQRTEARQAVARLRALPESTRERLLLRLVEGIPGPELAQVLRVMEGELKTDLERGAMDAARLLGQSGQGPGDTYLWDLVGTPSPLVARLEMLFPVLRYDGASAAQEVTDERPASAATHLELGAVGAGRKPTLSAAKAEAFGATDETTSAHGEPLLELTAPGGLERTRAASGLPPQAQANPFGPAVRTVAATDLPVAAQGVVPPPPPPPPPARASVKPPTGSRPTLPRSGASSPSVGGPPPPMMGFDEQESTKAEVPPALARAQARAAAGTAVVPEPAPAETRIGPAPVAQPAPPPLDAAPEPEPTRMQPMPSVPPRPIPALTGRSLLVGATPFLLAGLLVVAAVVAGWTGLFTSETQAKRAWTLVPVVVAAADLNEGDALMVDAIATRQVPEAMVKSASFVRPDNVTFVLGQRLLSPMQEGDPLCWSHLSDLEHSRRLSVQRRGRAYTIGTSAVTSVGRHLKPGDRVDVLATLERPLTKRVEKPGAKNGKRVVETVAYTERVAVTLMQDILVLATGKVLPTTHTSRLDERTLAYSNISVLVLPEEAEQLALAAQLGTVTLSLRTEDDHELLDTPSKREFTNANTLLTGDRTRALFKKRQGIIQQIRGGPSK